MRIIFDQLYLSLVANTSVKCEQICRVEIEQLIKPGESHVHSEGSTAEAGQEEENGQVVTGNGGGHELDTMDNGLSPTSMQNADDETTEEMENVVSSESEAPISERAASGFSDSPTVGSPRVQFEKIKEEEVHHSFKKDEVPSVGPSANHDEDRKCRRHQKHEHK